MPNPSSPAAANDPKAAWRALVDRIKAGEAVLGERLYLLGAGPVPVEGALGGAMTLDGGGGIVLVVALAEASAGAGDQIAGQFGALRSLPGAKLREAGVDPESGGGLAARHASYFGLAEPVELNSAQRTIVVLADEPPDDPRTALTEALGDWLGGMFVVTGAEVAPIPAEPEGEIVLEPEAPAEEETEAPHAEAAPEDEAALAEAEEEEAPEADEVAAPADAEPAPEGPAEIEATLDAEAAPEGEAAPEAEAPTEGEAPVDEQADAETPTEDVGQAPPEDADQGPDLVRPYLEDESSTVIAEEADAVAERTGLAAWPAGNWIGLAMVAVGLLLAYVGIRSTNPPETEPQVNDEIRTVATGVTPDATHGRWIGQQRVVTLSDGTLVFVYSTGESLNLVEDAASSGATWEEPLVVDTVAGATSLSVDVDSKDRIHVAYSDGASINYVRLKNKPNQWKPSRIIQLDDDTTSLQVDVAWDEQNQTAHVVWVQQSDEGEAPAWAALTNEGGIHLTEEGILASAGTEVAVLVSVAADGRSSLLITYRRGDQTTGWSSRWSGGRLSDGTWAFNEEEEVPIGSFVGAVDVLYDRQRTAHLVLRDDDGYNVSYFTKTAEQPWSEGEIAVQGESTEDVDFPTLSYNAGEGNLYLFFQTEEFDPAGEVNYMVHELGGTGWQGPFDITNPADAPEGALYPVVPDRVGVQTVVFWTRTGDAYQVDSAPVAGPQT